MELQNSNLEDSQVDSESGTDGKFLIFTIGKEDYGIPISDVLEIIGIQSITELPDIPDYMKGVINLRGKVIPVIDVRLRFGLSERDYDERTCIVVVKIGESTVGLIVDSVAEVQDISDNNIEPPPRINGSKSRQYIMGLGKVSDEVKILLNINDILQEEELGLITEETLA